MKFLKPRTVTFIASADFTGKKYHGVKLHTTEGQVALAAANQAEFVLMNEPKSGEEAECALIGGGAQVHSGAAFALGAYLTTDANSKFVAATTGQRAIARAWSAAAGADEYVQVERVELYVP
jgi:hypothetical protein